MREAQLLPLGWRHLTAVDLAHVKHIVDEAAHEDGATLRQLEACLLLWATLTTGREAAQLLTAHVQMLDVGKEPACDGLYRNGGDWGWWLSAGVPRSQKRLGLNFASALRPWAERIYLPAAEAIVLLVERCVGHRLADGDDIADRRVKLFANGRALLRDMERLLAARNPIGDGRARKAAATAEALARWLPAAVIEQAGGDVVPAAIISGRVDRVARTPVYYGSAWQRDVEQLYLATASRLDRIGNEPRRRHDVHRALGDCLTPTDEAVRRLAARLRDRLEDARASLAQRHRVMTNYTVALLAFAVAHRGERGELPSIHAVDPDTRFCWIADKVVSGQPVPRLVWICDTALEQLRRYDEHLERLRASGVDVPQRGATDELPLFTVDEAGRLAPISVLEAMNEAVRDAGMMPRNAGRHWLRAALLGRCSSETLFALFGHGPLDEGSWGEWGGLDPVAYRADLARALDPLMRQAGWVPSGPGLGMTRA